ncbi:transcriptional regulator [Sphingomonas sp. LY29]|uniref:winged helix-turn-helix domain-containing protein n=1 Tax=Sphingomonas sp. LY29 TaxID=3095341 RepID=UPI002D79A161|nr:transcriptional regulator [Sphingomonas sp. LY29]WRP26074.1 transcriptional regulator [Sphingomonas sp. LY29]
MSRERFRFGRFTLDPADRRLTDDGAPIDLNARYLDALILLLREQGRLVAKDRFMAEVWRGIPVTDEALTQCIKSLRRLLGDNASAPSFIETVPKHGYRFIAPVEWDKGEILSAPPAVGRQGWGETARLTAAGTLGGAIAGAVGGLFYGASAAVEPGVGASSSIVVLTLLTILLAAIGAAGVSGGIALARRWVERPGPWLMVGGAAGGLLVGAITKLIGLDAFRLLFGTAPADFAGATEGALLGWGVGLGAMLAASEIASQSARRAIVLSGAIGAAMGLAITALGGRIMGGSLAALASEFPQSRLQLGSIGRLFGEAGFGPISLATTAALEGALFSACVVGALAISARRSSRR